jgi:hypothetical protein
MHSGFRCPRTGKACYGSIGSVCATTNESLKGAASKIAGETGASRSAAKAALVFALSEQVDVTGVELYPTRSRAVAADVSVCPIVALSHVDGGSGLRAVEVVQAQLENAVRRAAEATLALAGGSALVI